MCAEVKYADKIDTHTPLATRGKAPREGVCVPFVGVFSITPFSFLFINNLERKKTPTGGVGVLRRFSKVFTRSKACKGKTGTNDFGVFQAWGFPTAQHEEQSS